MKRLFDILSSSAAILVLSPLLVPIMIVLRLTGEGHVFYRQERMGRGGKPFFILKFATMLKNSPSMPGGDITSRRDPRVLPVGHVLRKTKINELPQLFNILFGDMSVIGPRPFTPRVAAMFPAEHWQRVGQLRPGLSGVGSIVFRDEEALVSTLPDRDSNYAAVIVPYKCELEAWYAQNQSFPLDMKLIVMTFAAVLNPALDARVWLRTLPPPSPQLQLFQARAREQVDFD